MDWVLGYKCSLVYILLPFQTRRPTIIFYRFRLIESEQQACSVPHTRINRERTSPRTTAPRMLSTLLCAIVLVVNQFTTQTVKASGPQKSPSYSSPAERQGILIRKLRSYEIDFPTITDGEKYHLGYLTDSSSRRRRRRAINLADDTDHFHYKFKANGEEYHMRLRINKHLFGPDFKVEHFYGNGSIESVKMQEHCYLIGETIPHQYGVAVSDCDGLYGVVNTDDDMLYIEPLVNDSYVDKAKLNGTTGRPHLIYKHSQLPKHDLGLDGLDLTKIGHILPRIEPANSRQTPRNNIHYSFLTFINRSGRIVKLMWVDRRKKRSYFATLMPGTARKVNTFTSHRWVAVDEETDTQFLVGNKKEFIPKKNKQSRRTNVLVTLPRGLKLVPTSEKQIREKIGTKWIESMAVADKSIVKFHSKEGVSRYIMALMNVVAYIFKHKSLGFNINYVLVRIVLLHKDPEGVTLLPSNPNKSLLSACDFMHKIRIGRTDDDPKFHDHATFLTRQQFGTAAGYAPVYGMCHPVRSCTLNGEDGFPSAFIIAHETGHSLGMEHDGERNRCASVTSHGSIMAPLVQARMNRFLWSSCSRKELMGSIRNFHCLNDKPGEKHKDDLPFLHRYPGVHYSTDDQCLFDFGKGYKFCTAFHRDPCRILWCNMPAPHTHLCKSMRAPALNGTKCGKSKWCIAGRCVQRTEKIEKPKAIDGNWSDWQNWKTCSQECGYGIRTRERGCNNPRPRNGGKECVGNSTEQDICMIKECEHTIPLRADELKKQCALIGKEKDKYRSWSFYDESKVNLNCTFERNLCSWVNLKRDDNRDWQLNRGKTRTGKTGPSVDHTLNTTRGQYIYFESSSPAKSKDRAGLASRDLGVRRACLSFWYHMYGKGMGSLKVVRVNVNGRKILWTQHTNQGDQWLNAQIDIKEDRLYNLIIEAHRKDSYLSDIALDDITFTATPCAKDNKIEDSVNPCVVSCLKGGSRKNIVMGNFIKNGIRCRDSSALDICIDGECRKVGCDDVLDSGKMFDKCGVCSGDGTSCKRNEGNIERTPKEDIEMVLNVPHGSSSLNVRKNSNSDNLLALSVRDPSQPSGVINVINGNDQESPPAIYYGGGTQYVYTHEYGAEVIKSLGTVKQDVILNIKAKNKGIYSPVEVIYEYYDKEHIKQAIAKKITDVEEVKKNESKSTAAVEVSTGPPDVLKVAVVTEENTTEETITEEKESKLEPRWVIYDEWSKCTRTCNKGVSFRKFFCKIGDKIKPRSRCSHLVLNVKQRYKFCNDHPCKKTFTWTPAPWSACSKTCSLGIMTREVSCIKQPGNKQVKPSRCKELKPSETKSCILKNCEPTWSTGNWSKCSETCGLGSQTRDVFCIDQQGQRTNGCDKTKQPEERRSCRKPACASPPPDPLDCDFEKDLCEWKQMRNDHFNWQRNQGKTKSSETGPNHDHTFKNRTGHYMFMEASNPRRVGDEARLISPEVNVRQACLTFYYHMWGRGSGSLRVKFLTKAGYMDEITWEKTGNQGERWIKAEVNIPSGLSYQIVIEVTRGKGWRGDIAIDDILFHHMECQERNKEGHPVIHSGKKHMKKKNKSGNRNSKK